MAGAGIFILSLFLIVSVILNASNTFLAIADTLQEFDTNANIPNANNPNTILYDVPNWSLEKALAELDDDPNEFINYLGLGQAYYQAENTDEARIALNDGREVANNQIRYLATATSVAENSDDTPAAMVYGILLWNLTQNTDSDIGQIAFTNVSQFLYTKSLEIEDIDLSRDNDVQIEFLNRSDTRDIVRSQITRILIASNHIEMGRVLPAEVSLRLWNDETWSFPIAQLVDARYEIMIENFDSAIMKLNQLIEASTTPEWIVTIAQDLINSFKD